MKIKILDQIKRWLYPPKLPTLEQMKDLLEATIMNFITEDFHLMFDIKQQSILAWIDNRYYPISFNIIILFERRYSAKNFVKYVTSQLRKAGIEL